MYAIGLSDEKVAYSLRTLITTTSIPSVLVSP